MLSGCVSDGFLASANVHQLLLHKHDMALCTDDRGLPGDVLGCTVTLLRSTARAIGLQALLFKKQRTTEGMDFKGFVVTFWQVWVLKSGDLL